MENCRKDGGGWCTRRLWNDHVDNREFSTFPAERNIQLHSYFATSTPSLIISGTIAAIFFTIRQDSLSHHEIDHALTSMPSMPTSMNIGSESKATGRFQWPSSSVKFSLRTRRSQNRISVTPQSNSRPSAIVNPSSNVYEASNKVPVSKASIIHSLCNQISKGLYEASDDSLNNELLQELSDEIFQYSLLAIKRKRMSSQSNDVDVLSTDGRSLRIAINQRMASVVEKSSDVLRPVEKVKDPVSSKSRKVSIDKIPFHLFTKFADDRYQYDVFLNICDPNLKSNLQQVRNDYIAFKRSDTNIPFIIFILILGIFYMGTEFVWSHDINTYREYPMAVLSIVFAFLTGFSLLWVALNRVTFLSFRYDIVCLQRFHKYVTKLYVSSYGQWPENITMVCGALTMGLYLVNIVLMKLCIPGMVVNVGKNNHILCDSFVEPPPESYVTTVIMIVLLKIACRGVHRIALICSWVVVFVAVNMSIYLSNNGNYVWLNILILFMIGISYELERQPLRMYLKTLKAIEASEIAAKLNARLANYENLQAAEALKAKCSLVHTRLLL